MHRRNLYPPQLLSSQSSSKGKLQSQPGIEMSAETNLPIDLKHGLIPRETICLPDISKDQVLHTGDAGFPEVLQQYFVSPENDAMEQLIALKAKLRPASTYNFWNIFLEEICKITGSQCSFVSKRILVNDHNTAVEMPPLGEPGSCLMVGVIFRIIDLSILSDSSQYSLLLKSTHPYSTI